jgi:hypothetical protein
MAVVKKMVAGTGSTYHSYFSDLKNYQNFTTLMEAIGGTPNPGLGDLGGVTATAGDGGSNGNTLWNPFGLGWHMMAMRYDGTNLEVWLDDFKVISKPATINPLNSADLLVGSVFNNALTSNYAIAEMALYNTALSNADMLVAYNAMHYNNSALPMADAKFIVAEGDSISTNTFGFLTYQMKYALATPMLGINYAVVASTLQNMIIRQPTLDAMLPSNLKGRKHILSSFIGTNDLGLSNGSVLPGWINSYAAYCDARRALGWKVVVCTLLPSNRYAAFNTDRATVNNALRGWVGVHCDALVDFAADATMGPDSACTNTTYYMDGIHPTEAGHNILMPIWKQVIDGM